MIEKNQHSQDIWRYVRGKKIELGESVSNKKAVFLDLNYWIDLRKANNGESKKEYFNEILIVARELVDSGKCFFPLTDSMFYEILKQDGQYLSDTLALIDELSSGICIDSLDQRVEFELLDFLEQAPDNDKYTARELLWTKPYFIVINKLPIPNPEFFSPQDRYSFQQKFVDDHWEKGFSFFSDQLVEGDEISGAQYPDRSAYWNEGKALHTHEYSSFHELFLNEIVGAIETVEENIKNIAHYISEKSTGEAASGQAKESIDESRTIEKLIYNIFRLKSAKQFLPNLHITSGCHAAMRWEPKIKFDSNHQFDFEHAACALPYCEYFFAEKQLTHIVTQGLLGFDKVYGCEVIAKPQAALAVLERLLQDT